MSLEQAGTSASWFLPMWIDRFYWDNDNEAVDDTPEPILLLPYNGRNLVWGLTRSFLGSKSYGIAGQSCILLERYLATRLRGLAVMSLQQSDWERKKQELKNKIVLLAAVSIQLCTKMGSAHSHLSNRALESGLRKHGLLYSLADIIAAEADVYQGLGFRIPLWTNVEKAHLLAREMGLGEILETVSLIMDIVEYGRVELQEQIQSMNIELPAASTSRGSDDSHSSRSARLGPANIRNMHLIAGTVAAARLLMLFPDPDPIPRLAFYTRTSSSYIFCISNVIVNYVIRLRDGVKRPNEVDSLASLSKRQRHM